MLRISIRGLSPLLMHNGQLSDPQNQFSRDMSAITSKRKKTDRDRDELSRVEFLGGLYVDEKGRPVMPGENIEAMLQSEGGRNKMKRQVQAGVICDGLFPIIGDHPKSLDGLWNNRTEYALRKSVRNQANRVIRTRPIFRSWALVFDLEILEEEINAGTVEDFVRAAGRHTGLGDWRPKFGRFTVENVEEIPG